MLVTFFIWQEKRANTGMKPAEPNFLQLQEAEKQKGVTILLALCMCLSGFSNFHEWFCIVVLSTLLSLN
jgi:hypothetical protein